MNEDKILKLTRQPLTPEQVKAMFPEPKTLDITDWKLTGKELGKQIEEACNPEHNLVQQQSYDELLLTQAQFNDLQATMGRFESYIEGYYVYITRHNAMEVRVKK